MHCKISQGLPHVNVQLSTWPCLICRIVNPGRYMITNIAEVFLNANISCIHQGKGPKGNLFFILGGIFNIG